mmetsp:Transcript_100897/g.289632  ORF Transcript_100897/g.289632 Transcript_100897/m.289632 type:complete len:205 (+) Transcript_100897:1863-2477(+)
MSPNDMRRGRSANTTLASSPVLWSRSYTSAQCSLTFEVPRWWPPRPSCTSSSPKIASETWWSSSPTSASTAPAPAPSSAAFASAGLWSSLARSPISRLPRDDAWRTWVDLLDGSFFMADLGLCFGLVVSWSSLLAFSKSGTGGRPAARRFAASSLALASECHGKSVLPQNSSTSLPSSLRLAGTSGGSSIHSGSTWPGDTGSSS